MSRDAPTVRPTRRQVLLGVAAGLGTLAGCPGDSDGGSAPEASTDESDADRPATRTETATVTPTPADTPTATATPESAGGSAGRLVRRFYTAADAGEFDQANALVHPDSPEGTISQRQQALFERQDITVRNLTVTEAGTDRSVVRVELALSRDGRRRTTATTLVLRRHEGRWRLYSTEQSG